MSTPVDPQMAAQNKEVERQLKEVRPSMDSPHRFLGGSS